MQATHLGVGPRVLGVMPCEHYERALTRHAATRAFGDVAQDVTVRDDDNVALRTLAQPATAPLRAALQRLDIGRIEASVRVPVRREPREVQPGELGVCFEHGAVLSMMNMEDSGGPGAWLLTEPVSQGCALHCRRRSLARCTSRGIGQVRTSWSWGRMITGFPSASSRLRRLRFADRASEAVCARDRGDVRRVADDHRAQRPTKRAANEQLRGPLDLLRVLVELRGLLSAERREGRVGN
jgi:hypothetical protein